MEQPYRRQILFGISLMLAVYIFMSTIPVLAQNPQTGQSSLPAEPPAAEAIEVNVSGMTDDQVRQAYTQKLKQESTAKIISMPEAPVPVPDDGVWLFLTTNFYGAARSVAAGIKQAGTFFSGEKKNPGQWRDAVFKLTDGKGGFHFFLTLIGLAVVIAVGLTARWLFRRTTSDIQENILSAVHFGKLQFIDLRADHLSDFCPVLPGGNSGLPYGVHLPVRELLYHRPGLCGQSHLFPPGCFATLISNGGSGCEISVYMDIANHFYCRVLWRRRGPLPAF
jgi:hypothetical protein